jgi:CRISPR-associated endonuclease/helicase Cas3
LWRFAAALKALVMASDVAGSAMAPKDIDIATWVNKTLSSRTTAEDMKRVVAVRLKGETERPFQTAIGDSRRCVTLVEAGCGTGKTAAAYMWAKRHAEEKSCSSVIPQPARQPKVFGYVHETDVEAELIHSRSIVDLAGIARVVDDDKGDHLLRIESLNAWSPKVIICTADTVLALVRNNRRGLYNSPAILSGAFVFDELHAYDNTMLEAVVALIRALPGASFLLMTASLPKNRKEFLHEYIEDIAEVPSPHDLEELPRYLFERRATDDEACRVAEEYVARGKRVLWICNQVARAQAVFERFKDRCPAANYHSRFKYEHRVNQHRRIIRAFDDEESANGFVAVTTQVAEMSLDLDADLLISEVAPIPALIQRLGRLNRRITSKRPGTPRTALSLSVKVAPYDEAALQLADKWIDELMELRRPLTQTDLALKFNALAPHEELRLNLHTRWLDSGWLAEPEPVRDVGYSVSVILAEDARACRESSIEIVKRAIPMSYKEKLCSTGMN